MDIILDKFKVEKYFDMASQIMSKAKDGKSNQPTVTIANQASMLNSL